MGRARSSTVDDAITDGSLTVDGDTAAVSGIFDLLEDFPFWFPIVQP